MAYENYYVNIKSKMMKEFYSMYKSTQKVLQQYFDESKISKLRSESKNEYLNLFSQIPYIGGKKNKETINLIMGAIILAIVRPLEKEKFSEHEIGRIIYETFDGYFKAKPLFLQRIIGKLASTDFFIKWKKKQIKKTLSKKYKEDFVIEYVESEGKNFDFGYNYTECAIHKLYVKHNALQYLPYVCLGDYALFNSLGIGFKRTQTIGNGCDMCDFRFKKNSNTPIGWPPEALEEWKDNNASIVTDSGIKKIKLSHK